MSGNVYWTSLLFGVQKIFQIGRHEVLVTWKRIKRLNLRIDRNTGEIRSSVPLMVTDEEVRAFLEAREVWLDKHTDQIARAIKEIDFQDNKASVCELNDRLQSLLPDLLSKWTRYWGVTYNRVVIKDVRSYWGLCRPARGEICFNVRLGAKPVECIEYVVAHELLHMLISGHGKDFYSAMDRAMPDWKERRRKLRNY